MAKKTKNENDMNTKRSKTSLAVCYPNPVFMDCSEEGMQVIACGYSNGLKYGYFICTETKDNTGYFIYSNIVSFHPKVDNRTYQMVLQEYQKLQSTS